MVKSSRASVAVMFPPSRRSRFHTRGPTRNAGDTRDDDRPSLPRLLFLAALVLMAAFGLASLVKRDAPVSVSGAARCATLGKGAGYCLGGAQPMEPSTPEARCESFGKGGEVCPTLGASN
jgi:hypothetical protein